MATKKGKEWLSAREVHAAKAGDLSDGKGLLLRVAETGASWVFRYTSPTGRRREMGLGPAHRGSLAQAGQTLAAARDAADEARKLLGRSVDPLEARDARRKAEALAATAKKAEKAREHLTLCRAAREYHERVIEPTKTAKHSADWINSLENHLPASVWHKPIADIEPPELLRALAAMRAHERSRRVEEGSRVSETVQRIRQRLDAIFEDAMFYKRCTTNPAAAIRRKMREELPMPKAGKFAALDYRQAPALMGRLRAADGTAARCLEFAVLTASRTAEALCATWGEFDLEAATWVIPGERMKKGEPHTVYLSPRAVEILKAQRGQHDRWVFPTPQAGREGEPLSNMAMLTVLGRLGARGATTVHGLCRASFSSWAAESGAGRPDVVEACLAHREADIVRRAYMRAEFAEERRALLAAWAGFLAGAEVIAFPQRGAA
jgi:integrase